MATLIMTAKLNDIDPQSWLADVLARINDHAVDSTLLNPVVGTGLGRWSVFK